MERSLKEIIKEVGKEYEMEDEVINDIIKRLQKEFYVKLKHMKNLTIDTWKFLGLPINLYYVINELYQSALNEQQGSLPHPEQPKNVNNVINEKKSYNPPPPQYQSQKQSQMSNNNYQKNNNRQQISLNNAINMLKDLNSLPNIVHKDLSIKQEEYMFNFEIFIYPLILSIYSIFLLYSILNYTFNIIV